CRIILLPMPAATATEQDNRSGRGPGFVAPFTLSVDIGGTYLKAAVLDCRGGAVAERIKVPTPKPSAPSAVLSTIEELTAQFPAFHRVPSGFPGVVKGGTVFTAPTLGTECWAGYKHIAALSERFRVPARILND